jgi:hypothetical protein
VANREVAAERRYAMGITTIWGTELSKVECLERDLPSIVTRRQVRKEMGKVRKAENLIELLRDVFTDQTVNLFEKCRGLLGRVLNKEILVNPPKKGVMDPISYNLGDIISRRRYSLLRGVLADFIYRAATLMDSGLEDATGVPWRDAKGFKLPEFDDPIGIYWPVVSGREPQRKGRDPIWFDRKPVGQTIQLFQLPQGSNPIFFCGRPYPWVLGGKTE